MSGGRKRGEYEKPVGLDMDFGEALERFAQADPGEVRDEQAKAQALRLVQHEDAGPTLLIYESDHGTKAELRFDGEEPWFTQKQLSDIFGVDVRTANHHVTQFLESGELDASVIRKIRITAADGKAYEVNHYTLDVAYYVGYRVNSARGVLFRKWATTVLKQVARHGYYVDRQRLVAGGTGITDDLKETIREIRTAPENAYREVKRIVSMCQDYDPASPTARTFYARMENMMLYIASGRTAPELIKERADPKAPNMGLTFYTGSRGPTQKDAQTGNFYLDQNEARHKGRVTFMLLDYFEEQLDQGRLVTMAECEDKLINFIKFNSWPLLTNAGSVSRDDANKIAIARRNEYLALKAIADEKPATSALPKSKKRLTESDG
jgi:hypothetical protein